MDFNENLKEARKRCNFTQQEIADILGIDKSTYSGYETGKREPDVKKIKALSTILSVTPDFLLGTEDYCNKNEISFENGTLEIATAYENADFDTKNNVRFLLKLPLLNEEMYEKSQSDQKEFIELAARGGKIRIEKDKAIELAKNAKAAPNSANRKDLF